MAKPSPYQITAFAQSARERSFSQAAITLGVSQSSITQHITKLEAIVGAQLFVRRRSGLELTRAGRELFEIADRWAALNTLFNERISNYAVLDEGYLKITATAPRPALPLIAAYNRLYPNVRIDFTLLNWTQNMTALKERTVDIAIMAEPALDDGMYAQKIEQVGYRAYMRRDHPLSNRRSLTLAELSETLLIIPEDGSLTQRVLFEETARRGIALTHLMRMTTFAVVKEAILHGLGVGMLLENSIHETARLRSVPVEDLDRMFTNYLVVPSEKQHLRIIKRFLDEV